MAIDDNTQYSLSGAQVKDLAARINSGAVKILTSSDYNYPTATPDCIWPGLLSDGVYSFASGVRVKWTTGNYYFTDGGLLIVGPSPASLYDKRVFAITKSSLRDVTAVNDFNSSGTNSSYVVDMSPQDNLTTSANYLPLAASQGKALNDKIEGRVKTLNAAPSTSTQGTKGQLLEDTSNGKLYICTAVTAQGTTPETYTYTWEEVGTGGGGGITTLTSADYNYHYGGGTDNRIAPWLLDDGLYMIDGTGGTTNMATDTNGSYLAVDWKVFINVTSQGRGGSGYEYRLWTALSVNTANKGCGRLLVSTQYRQDPNSNWTTSTDARNLGSNPSDVLLGRDIINDLNASSTAGPYRALSAYQGKILNDKIEGRIKTNAGAPTTSTVGTVGQLLEDTTNGKLYICTAVSGSTYTWEEIDYSGLTTLSYGNSTWNDFLTAYNAGKIVYCRASSNSNPATGTQGRMAFMAYINNPTTPTEVEFQYVRSVSSKTAAQPCDQVFVYKLTSAGGGTWTVESRNMTYKVAAGTNVTTSYSNGTVTINAEAPVITMQSTDPGEGAALAANNFIAVYDAS